ncbi:MAG: WYL domain-containing protein, partial [Oscillospiraceae bacterium]
MSKDITSEIIESGAQSWYDMSYYTYRQLQRDHIRFEEEYTERFRNDYICRILINYMCYAQKSFLEQFENDTKKRMMSKQCDKYKGTDRISLTKLLTEKILEFDFPYHKDFKKRTLITFILEQFTLLPLSEREIIYCYSQYNTITEAIDNNELLLVKISSGKEYEIKPYSIKIDENSLSYYLVGYSRPKGSENEYEGHSFKLSRIEACRSKHKESILSYTETRLLKEIIEKFGSAYIVGNLAKKDIEKTTVRLSERGYKTLFLKVIAHQRPIPITEPQLININDEEFYDLTFDCSHQQIKNYFFSFGAEAEIRSPEWLREKFFEDYKASRD